MNLKHHFDSTDNALLEVSSGGERFVALFRLFIYFIIWTIPFSLILLRDDNPQEVQISFLIASFALLFSIVAFLLSIKNIAIPKMIWITTTLDITLVTVTLLVFALGGKPLVATNSMVIWQIYPVAIFGASLRLDFRQTILSGTLAVIQYAALVYFINNYWELTTKEVLSETYGSFNWPVQISRLVMLVCITAVAIGFVGRSRKLVTYSGTDSLTGLKNRSYFEHNFNKELKKMEVSHGTLSLAFLDLDHFKNINDKYGHDAGDLALIAVAEVFNKHARAKDIISRWGGEEFIILFPNTPGNHAKLTLEAIMAELEKGIMLSSSNSIKIQLSGGISEYPKDGSTTQELLGIADNRLFYAKRNGRNKLILEDIKKA